MSQLWVIHTLWVSNQHEVVHQHDQCWVPTYEPSPIPFPPRCTILGIALPSPPLSTVSTPPTDPGCPAL